MYVDSRGIVRGSTFASPSWTLGCVTKEVVMSSDNPESARVRILSDHDHLRDLMRDVRTSASEALLDEKRRPSVRRALAELRRTLERHLDYEESVLVPLLAAADAWGPIR